MLKYTNPYNILDYKFTVLVFFFFWLIQYLLLLFTNIGHLSYSNLYKINVINSFQNLLVKKKKKIIFKSQLKIIFLLKKRKRKSKDYLDFQGQINHKELSKTRIQNTMIIKYFIYLVVRTGYIWK